MTLITGAGGQLGTELSLYLGRLGVPFTALGHRELDITDRAAADKAVTELRPRTVFCCGAYTNVDLAESEPSRCNAVNAAGALYLAEACERINAALVYPSTDYVFDGEKNAPYGTGDAKRPLSVYGESKSRGEDCIINTAKRFYIVRVSRLFGLHGGNFVKTMLKLAERGAVRAVDDQVASPTYTADLAPLLYQISQHGPCGIYHAANQGSCSFAEWAEEAYRLAGLSVTVERVSAREFAAPALRPAYSELSTASLDEAGFKRPPHWRDALERFLAARKRLSRISD